MVALVSTVAYLGLEARGVEVQCQVAPGLPAFNIVGLPDKAVAESRERVRAAIAALGLSLPPKRITINLSPADLPKEGSHYDLPIALALLTYTSQLYMGIAKPSSKIPSRSVNSKQSKILPIAGATFPFVTLLISRDTTITTSFAFIADFAATFNTSLGKCCTGEAGIKTGRAYYTNNKCKTDK